MSSQHDLTNDELDQVYFGFIETMLSRATLNIASKAIARQLSHIEYEYGNGKAAALLAPAPSHEAYPVCVRHIDELMQCLKSLNDAFESGVVAVAYKQLKHLISDEFNRQCDNLSLRASEIIADAQPYSRDGKSKREAINDFNKRLESIRAVKREAAETCSKAGEDLRVIVNRVLDMSDEVERGCRVCGNYELAQGSDALLQREALSGLLLDSRLLVSLFDNAFEYAR